MIKLAAVGVYLANLLDFFKIKVYAHLFQKNGLTDAKKDYILI